METRRLPMKRIAAGLFLLLLLIILAIMWTRRISIATGFVAREFERRGVQASYTITRIGFRTQRLENLVIGDPKRPDLTARLVEVRISWGLRRPSAGLISARGVRLYGRVASGRLSLGQVDKLLPPPSGLPFRLPDQEIDVADASIRLDTPAGRIGAALEGRGNLADGFRGRLAAVSRRLDASGCRLESVHAHWSVAIDDLRPGLNGPAFADAISCPPDFGLTRVKLDMITRLEPALDRWKGTTGIEAASLRYGDTGMARLAGRLSFDGDSADTRGRLAIGAERARVESFVAARTALDGSYAFSARQGRFTMVADANARGVTGGERLLGPLREALSSLGGTPVEPVGEALAGAMARFQQGFDVDGALKVVNETAGGAVRFERLSAIGKGGARIALAGGDGLSWRWPKGGVGLDGTFTLLGGGFPASRFTLSQSRIGGPIEGRGTIAPIEVRGARLALGEIRFGAGGGGTTRISSVATIDGPIDDGRVSGLVVPVSGRFGRGGFAFGEGCTSVSFRTMRIAGLSLGPTRLPLCPTGRALAWQSGGRIQGGALVRQLRLAGRLGGSPISLDSSSFRFDLGRRGFTGSDVDIRLGASSSLNRLQAATVTGRFGKGVTGTFAGLSGRLANVSLLIDRGKGDWAVRDGRVSAGGSLLISDPVEPPRFYPLVTNDFRMTLINNRIDASGWLHDPETGTRIVRADIDHHLATGRGRALLDVPGIRFDENYQPEQLTRLTTGVVALVRGVLKGQGEIAWNERGTQSSGIFSTDDMDFAASFGPVEGLSTTLRFTDLLGLVSAPGQLAETQLIRTGIDVYDGRIRYQLLPGLRVKVESGRWPFAGGLLILEETILDFSKPSAKHLTFRVEGMDAARFVQQMEFSNISATGTFDGVIPMVFDERGGRIVDGRLTARPEGGTLSYIGELTDKDLGAYGKLAFDALKSMQYKKLTVVLNGSLEGEFIAGIELDGIARDPALTVAPRGGIQALVARRALNQLARIPFEFNITVKGPFRTLLATTRSLEDPTNLIQSVLPDLLRNQPSTTTVQPQESETKP